MTAAAVAAAGASSDGAGGGTCPGGGSLEGGERVRGSWGAVAANNASDEACTADALMK
jgi:hypothetical protein